MPFLFIHGKKDKIVPISHSRKLFKDYTGPAKIHELEIDHNDPRPKWIKQEIKTFFLHKFTEAKKKKELSSQLSEVLKSKIDHEDLDSKRAQEIFKKVGYLGLIPGSSASNKENSQRENHFGKPLYDCYQT